MWEYPSGHLEEERENEAKDPSLEEDQQETEEKKQIAEAEEEGEQVEEAEEESIFAEEPIPRRGCLLGCATPLAVIFAIILIAIMIGYAKRNVLREQLLKRIVANTQNHVLSELPEDIDEKEVKAVFGKVENAMKEGRIDEEALTEAISQYQDATRRRLSLQERKQAINRLMEGLESAIIVQLE